jgi:hypothetical protein
MPIAIVNDQYVSSPSAYVSASRSFQEELPGRAFFQSDVTRSSLKEIVTASCTYPLRKKTVAMFLPRSRQFWVEGFSPTFVGKGATPAEARQDWELSVHKRFQELFNMRSFEMNSDDSKDWEILSTYIDVAVYRNRTPLVSRQFGSVSQMRPYPTQIRWDNGRFERVTASQIGFPDFITFKAGQRFEAIVERDPITFALLKIVHAVRKASPNTMTSEEEDELMKSIGSKKVFSTVGWD